MLGLAAAFISGVIVGHLILAAAISWKLKQLGEFRALDRLANKKIE